jgi:hypothetical protein
MLGARDALELCDASFVRHDAPARRELQPKRMRRLPVLVFKHATERVADRLLRREDARHDQGVGHGVVSSSRRPAIDRHVPELAEAGTEAVFAFVERPEPVSLRERAQIVRALGAAALGDVDQFLPHDDVEDPPVVVGLKDLPEESVIVPGANRPVESDRVADHEIARREHVSGELQQIGLRHNDGPVTLGKLPAHRARKLLAGGKRVRLCVEGDHG